MNLVQSAAEATRGKAEPETIIHNVSEAREELGRIEALVGKGGELSEARLSVMFLHAYHHLNVAWNARRVPTERYGRLTHADFNAWGSIPDQPRTFDHRRGRLRVGR